MAQIGFSKAAPEAPAQDPGQRSARAGLRRPAQGGADRPAHPDTGELLIELAGIYTFETTSEDDFGLFINSIDVLDNRGNRGSRTESGFIGLEPGRHPVEIVWFNTKTGKRLTATIRGADTGGHATDLARYPGLLKPGPTGSSDDPAPEGRSADPHRPGTSHQENRRESRAPGKDPCRDVATRKDTRRDIATGRQRGETHGDKADAGRGAAPMAPPGNGVATNTLAPATIGPVPPQAPAETGNMAVTARVDHIAPDFDGRADDASLRSGTEICLPGGGAETDSFIFDFPPRVKSEPLDRHTGTFGDGLRDAGGARRAGSTQA